MNKRQIIASLNNIANKLDVTGLYKEATSLTNVMKRLAEEETTEREEPKYDYTADKLLYSTLSDFGKNYVAERHRENPITSYRELDSAVEHAFKNGKGDYMFLSPFEQSQNIFTQISPDVAELLRGLFMIDRGIDNDKTFQSFKGGVFPALKKKMQERPSTETFDITTGNIPFERKTTEKSNDYHKLLRKAKSLVKKIAGEYWNKSGAQSSMDNLLRYILDDSLVPDEYKKEANSIMEEAQRLHDELKSDAANLPKLDKDLPRF